MPHHLDLGTRRAGRLFDFDPETPEIQVSLEHSDDGICVTVPWSEPDSPYAQWFDPDGRRQHLNGTDIPPRRVPRRLLFEDSHGSVLLIGCWAQGFHANVFGPGSGRVWASVAVVGVEEDTEYDRPHGLQTEISGLREWLGVTSWTREVDWSQAGTPATLHSTPPPAIEIDAFAGLALDLVPSWRIAQEEELDRWVLLDLVRCRTRSAQPEAWDSHLQLHRAIRDLLVLSRWWVESCVEVSATRDDDLIRMPDGKSHRPQWRHVVVPRGDRRQAPRGLRPHLVEFEDLGSAGIAQWIRLRDEFARALDPVISSIDLDAAPHTLLAHTGPGLEALGYLLMRRDGMRKKDASEVPLRARLERILEDVEGCLPLDGAAWIANTCRAYNALKHANRKAPDAVEMLSAWRQSVLVVRTWVALELGVSPADLASRLANDPQRRLVAGQR
ncbi:ApeA N-terminal domain 1-containing protein [Pimelobacter simplex]|uniref:ApeA N-terminal domain 1-containing protein n=1 Tax=Nocardioides simplex TaxID=2045 RepID=UPI00214FB5FA|nr:HEPN domain-containing protein [Pimelobacter simplex]UUW88979.1 hypothetical protein M0M43_25050 [Pimelobacter simplex]UUW98484.1 hypothetical protein M0M48_13700 [Pimelobacter simplex]